MFAFIEKPIISGAMKVYFFGDESYKEQLPMALLTFICLVPPKETVNLSPLVSSTTNYYLLATTRETLVLNN